MSPSLLGRAALAAALLGCGCASTGVPPAADVVEAEGWSEIGSAGTVAARSRALAEAQKGAVARATGVEVSVKTTVADAVLVEERIRSRAEGVIRRFEILSERIERGAVRVRIRAEVDRRPRARRARRVAVSLAPHLEQAVTSGLRARGFEVADDGEVHVRGHYRDHQVRDQRLAGLTSFRGRVDFCIEGPDGGFWRQEREVAAVDPIDELARAKALEAAAHVVAEAVASRFTP